MLIGRAAWNELAGEELAERRRRSRASGRRPPSDSRERESLAKQREAEHDLAAARRDTRLQVQDAYLSVKTGVARVAALEQSALSAQTALEATTLGRDVGTRTELDVLDAQQRLFAAQLDLAQARHDYLLGRIRLASAAAELGESDLRALNAYLTD